MPDNVSVGDYPYSPNTDPNYPYYQPWTPTYPTYVPQPQTVWITNVPSLWEQAAQRAYEAMEAYYKALTAQLEAAGEHKSFPSEEADE